MFHSGYPKLLFWMSEIIILDIQNKLFHHLYFWYPKYLLWRSKIIILNIQNKYFGYLKNGLNVNSACHTFVPQESCFFILLFSTSRATFSRPKNIRGGLKCSSVGTFNAYLRFIFVFQQICLEFHLMDGKHPDHPAVSQLSWSCLDLSGCRGWALQSPKSWRRTRSATATGEPVYIRFHQVTFTQLTD